MSSPVLVLSIEISVGCLLFLAICLAFWYMVLGPELDRREAAATAAEEAAAAAQSKNAPTPFGCPAGCCGGAAGANWTVVGCTSPNRMGPGCTSPNRMGPGCLACGALAPLYDSRRPYCTSCGEFLPDKDFARLEVAL